VYLFVLGTFSPLFFPFSGFFFVYPPFVSFSLSLLEFVISGVSELRWFRRGISGGLALKHCYMIHSLT